MLLNPTRTQLVTQTEPSPITESLLYLSENTARFMVSFYQKKLYWAKGSFSLTEASVLLKTEIISMEGPQTVILKILPSKKLK